MEVNEAQRLKELEREKINLDKPVCCSYHRH